MTSSRPETLTLPKVSPSHYPGAEVVNELCLTLFKGDAMYQGNQDHYLSVGASALNVIESARKLAGTSKFGSILDFGSGAGRVTRWLRAAYPTSALTTSDVRAADLEFCEKTFSSRSWLSGTDIRAMMAPETYDLIWVGSVLTHLSSDNTIAMLKKLLDWVSKDGLVVATFHGRFPYSWRNRVKYIQKECLPKIELAYEATGFGYSDYPDQPGYGISFCRPSWMFNQLESLPSVEVIMISERAWDTHQDVLVIRKKL